MFRYATSSCTNNPPMLVKYSWFQVGLSKIPIISWLFYRIDKIMPLGTAALGPRAIVHWVVHGTSGHNFDYLTSMHKITTYSK